MLEAIIDLKEKDANNQVVNATKVVIYDMFCDGVGYFCICPRMKIIKQTHPRGIDCLYEKIEAKIPTSRVKDEF